jgi:hypothetical protein
MKIKLRTEDIYENHEVIFEIFLEIPHCPFVGLEIARWSKDECWTVDRVVWDTESDSFYCTVHDDVFGGKHERCDLKDNVEVMLEHGWKLIIKDSSHNLGSELEQIMLNWEREQKKERDKNAE